MKFFTVLATLFFMLAISACAMSDNSETKYGTPPPGSHSPFSSHGVDESDQMREQPDPDDDRSEEEEPEEPMLDR